MSSAIIARWLKEVLQQAGIDVEEFKAHSCRGAATSTARQAGVAVKDIMETADWSRESTFTKFYYRTAKANPMASVVLSETKVFKALNIHCYI